MKPIIIYSLLLFLASNSLLSQDTVTIYYNKDWNIIPAKKGAAFYRKAYYDANKVWIANDYFINNKIQMSGSYKSKGSEIKQGHFIYYHENGQKLSEGNYLNDKSDGIWTTWYENGEKNTEGKYRNEVPEGNWCTFYDNGQKKTEGAYLAGKATGTWKFWHETGEKKSEGKFVNNEKEGLWNYWYPTGQLSGVENYSKGMIVSTTCYFKNSKVNYKGFYVNGRPQGEWTYWNVDGRMVFKGNFNKGQKEGQWTRYFREGEMKITYKNGMPVLEVPGGIYRNQKET
jgi:antitoxin component YwqK of YwqJK toxin-antitoxin module